MDKNKPVRSLSLCISDPSIQAKIPHSIYTPGIRAVSSWLKEDDIYGFSIFRIDDSYDLIHNHVANRPCLYFYTPSHPPPPPPPRPPAIRRVTIHLASGEDSLYNAILSHGSIDVIFTPLVFGDIAFSTGGKSFELTIERKKKEDFVSSIIDQRLHDQTIVMKRNIQDPAMCIFFIEGNPFEASGGLGFKSRLANIIYPLMRKQHSVFFGEDTESLANFIIGIHSMLECVSETVLAEKQMLSDRSPGDGVKKSDIIAENKLFYQLTKVPGVGEVTASSIYSHYKTLYDVCLAIDRTTGVIRDPSGEVIATKIITSKISAYFEFDSFLSSPPPPTKKQKINDEDD